MLQVINEGNQALVRATGRPNYLQHVCQIVVEAGGIAWPGWDWPNRTRSHCAVRPVAAAGHDEGYLDTANITWADTERRGPTGTAIRTGQPAISRNILTDPHYTPWRIKPSNAAMLSRLRCRYCPTAWPLECWKSIPPSRTPLTRKRSDC